MYLTPELLPITPIPPEAPRTIVTELVPAFFIAWLLVAALFVFIYFLIEVAGPLFDWFFDMDYRQDCKPMVWLWDIFRISIWPFYIVGVSAWFILFENRWLKAWRRRRLQAFRLRQDREARADYGL
jgi:hypothetical protein